MNYHYFCIILPYSLSGVVTILAPSNDGFQAGVPIAPLSMSLRTRNTFCILLSSALGNSSPYRAKTLRAINTQKTILRKYFRCFIKGLIILQHITRINKLDCLIHDSDKITVQSSRNKSVFRVNIKMLPWNSCIMRSGCMIKEKIQRIFIICF